MSILNSIKSKFSHGDGQNDQDLEDEFRRGIIDGRYPEGVDDFEPLSTTGNFVMPPEQRSHEYDDPMIAQSEAEYANLVANRDQAAQTGQQPYAAPQQSYGDQPQSYDDGQQQAYGAPQQAYGVQQPQQPYQGDPAASDMVQETLDIEEGVQVYERDEQQARPRMPREEAKPFRERLQERVAANVMGVQDEGLGRSKVATGEFAQTPDVVNAPDVIRRAPSADVPSDDLEREFSERRRANENARNERQRRNEQRNREFQEIQRRYAAERSSQDAASSQFPSPESDASQGFGAATRSQGAAASAAGTAAPHSISPSVIALPTTPVVVRTRTYDDISRIAQAVIGKHQPVVLPMRGTPNDVARRVLDFSFGLCCGCGASISELEDHVYCVTPRGTKLGAHELSALRHQGVLKG
jgi:FtsZ-interacting cell division protein YlmF